MGLTFDEIPNAISQLLSEVRDIKTQLAQNKSTPKDKNKLLTIKEASRVVNLAVPTIYALVGRKEIPFMKVTGGRRLYFLEEELTEWVKAGRQKTASEISQDVIHSIIKRKKK